MNVELPESEKSVTLRSLTRKQMRLIVKMDAEINTLVGDVRSGTDKDAALKRIEALTAERESMVRGLYPPLCGCWEDLSNRDVLHLMGATMDYSRAVPEEEIKNWLRSGNGETTQTA